MIAAPRVPSNAVLAVALLGLACACSTPAGANGPPGPEPMSASIDVGLTEWSVIVPALQIRPGAVTFHVTNVGATAHDLHVADGEGTWGSPELEPGQQAVVRATVSPGEVVHLWCAVPGHEMAGMHATLTSAPAPR